MCSICMYYRIHSVLGEIVCVCCNIIQLYCMHVVLIVCCCMYMLSVLIAMCCMHVVLIVCCCVVCVVCIYSCCCTYVCTGKEERLWPIVRLIIIIINNHQNCPTLKEMCIKIPYVSAGQAKEI